MSSPDIDRFGQPAFLVDVMQDGSFRYRRWNDPLLRRTGRVLSDVEGRTPVECMSPSLAQKVQLHYRRCVETGPVDFEEEGSLGTGSIWLRVSLTPLLDHGGTVIGILGLCTNITEVKQREAFLHAAAMRDAVTDVLNRRSFDIDLRRAVEAATLSGRGFSLVVADADRFKSVNDTYGHGIGDEILRHLALCFHAGLREDDRIYRIGGDEFAAILSAPSQVDAESALRRVEACLVPYMRDGRTIAVGFTVGFSIWAPGITAAELLALADADMYARKAACNGGDGGA